MTAFQQLWLRDGTLPASGEGKIDALLEGVKGRRYK